MHNNCWDQVLRPHQIASAINYAQWSAIIPGVKIKHLPFITISKCITISKRVTIFCYICVTTRTTVQQHKALNLALSAFCLTIIYNITSKVSIKLIFHERTRTLHTILLAIDSNF